MKPRSEPVSVLDTPRMLSEADRQFAVQLTRHLPIDYLEEACTLFLMGYSPDEVSERMQTIMPSD